MEPNIKPSVNDSRCVFFNTNSEDYRCAVILTVKRATGTFSLVGCLFVLFVIWLLRRYHSLAQKMILSLTVAAAFDSLAYIMGESHPEGSLCDFQAWWLTYFDWSALVWVCLITINIYVNLVREMSTNKYEIWITDDHVAWRFGIWYVPLFTLILLMSCCYARIICVANKRMQSWLGTFNPERERRKVSLAEEIKPLKWYPSVYLLVSIFPLINRLHDALHPQNPSFWLTLLHVLFAPLHGLANAFVFSLDRHWWSLLTPTGMQLALSSRLWDKTRIGEFGAGAARYTRADLSQDDDDDDDDDRTLFYAPDVTLKDRGP
ncbi:cyclic AMP receptor 4 isoform X2 [Stigmatopora argus]